jgi:L-asparaginase/Glu-tRNA(Gln) amidotransferase subunit D
MSLSLIYTGGTMGGRRRGRGPIREDYGLSSFLSMLTKKMPTPVRPLDLDALAVRPALSENRIPEDWPVLARAVDDAVRRGAEGVVVVHGTDTLLVGACLLDRMLAGIPVPVIFTGSNLPLGASGSDAVQNLGHAFRVARSRAARGVWVSYAGKPGEASLVLDPARARKEAFRSDCFQPLWGPAVGRVTGDAEQEGPLRLTWRPEVKRNVRPMPYTPCFELAPAALFWLHPGFDPRMIKRAVDDGVRGIVLAAYGSGTACMAPGRFDIRVAVHAAVRAGACVAVVSQHAGRVREAYGSTVDLVRAGARLMPETTPEAALAALMCGNR